MSQFEWYGFQSIDRTLSESELSILRECSSRARITSSSFFNNYSYGSFGGDEKEWMNKYFDIFVYLSNWGERRLMLKFPKSIVELKVVKKYCLGEIASCWSSGANVFVDIQIDDSEQGGWLEEEDTYMDDLLTLRKEVLSGDNRLLYLVWLLCVQYGDLKDGEQEPLVPAGLGTLSPALKAFVEFFNLDQELLESAKGVHPTEAYQIDEDDIEPIISGMSQSEKNTWLCRLALGGTPNLEFEFRKFIFSELEIESYSEEHRRTVGEIRQD